MTLRETDENISLYFGPFQGITDVYFRRLFMQYFGGVDKVFTPFFAGVDKDNCKSLKTAEIDPQLNNTFITIPQLLSKNADELLRFASHCKQTGYREINWNLGCPSPQVADKKRGSGLLPYPEEIDRILNSYFEVNPLILSVKCRFGLEHVNEFDSLLKVFNRYPISELIVHARVGRQRYLGSALAEEFKRYIPLLNLPLVYNGDIFSESDFVRYRNQFSVINMFMLGRGLLSDPFLAREMKGMVPLLNKKEILRDFVVELFHVRQAAATHKLSPIGKQKELWSYLMWSFDEPQTVWRIIRKTTGIAEYEAAVDHVFCTREWIGQGFGKRGRTTEVVDLTA